MFCLNSIIWYSRLSDDLMTGNCGNRSEQENSFSPLMSASLTVSVKTTKGASLASVLSQDVDYNLSNMDRDRKTETHPIQR